MQGSKRGLRDSAGGNKKCIRTEDGKMFFADPNALIRDSDYFKKLLHYDPNNEILIRGISGDTMKVIINFIETKTLGLNYHNVADALLTVDFMNLKDFSVKIRSVLSRYISITNCIQLYNATFALDHLDLFKLVRLYLQIHFKSIVCNSGFENLTLEYLLELLQDDNLNVHSEKDVINAIIKWVGCEDESRHKEVPWLLSGIRWEICDESLIRQVMEHPIVQKNRFCQAIAKPYKPGISKDVATFVDRIKALSGELVIKGPRQLKYMPCRAICHFGRDCGRLEIEISSTDDGNSPMIITDRRHTIPTFVTTHGSKIIMATLKSKLEAFDLVTKSWTIFPAPTKSPNEITYSLMNGHIFAVVIYKSPSPHLKVGIFNPESNSWSMNDSSTQSILKSYYYTIRSAAARGVIYVAVKGNSPESPLNTLACSYNIERDQWSPFYIPVSLRTLHFCLVSFKEELYFLSDQDHRVYKLDGRVRKWKPFQGLPYIYRMPTAVVHDETLIVCSCFGNHHNSAVWDAESGRWNTRISNSIINCNMRDEDVLWKYQVQIWESEWKTSAPTALK